MAPCCSHGPGAGKRRNVYGHGLVQNLSRCREKLSFALHPPLSDRGARTLNQRLGGALVRLRHVFKELAILVFWCKEDRPQKANCKPNGAPVLKGCKGRVHEREGPGEVPGGMWMKDDGQQRSGRRIVWGLRCVVGLSGCWVCWSYQGGSSAVLEEAPVEPDNAYYRTKLG